MYVAQHHPAARLSLGWDLYQWYVKQATEEPSVLLSPALKSSVWIAPQRSALLLTWSALSMCICLFRIWAKRKDEFFILRLQDPRGCLHCRAQKNRTRVLMQLCSAAPEGEAARRQLSGAAMCHPATSCWLCSSSSNNLCLSFISLLALSHLPPLLPPQKKKKKLPLSGA